MRLYCYLNEQNRLDESIKTEFTRIVTSLVSKPKNIITKLRNSWKKILDNIPEDKHDEVLSVVRKSLGDNSITWNDIKKVNEVSASPESKGFVNWLKSLLFQGRMGATIFTSLQIFFELDNLIDGEMPDMKRVLIYGFLWVLFSSTIYKDWKKGQA